MEIVPLVSDYRPAIETALRALPYLPSDWDRGISRDQQVRAAAAELDRAAAGEGIVATEGGAARGACAYVDEPWNTAFFEVPCGRVAAFFALDREAAAALARALTDRLARRGYRHVYAALDVRERWGSLALQRAGWRVTWSSTRVVCVPGEVDTSEFSPGQGDLRVVPHEPWHLRRLLAIAERLTEYSWLQWEERLHLGRRRTYMARLTESCCTTDFSPYNYTLLDRGEPVGHISSSIHAYPEEVARRRLAYRRNIFVDPDRQSAGHGKLLGLTACYHDQGRVDVILGRVRAEGSAMFRMLESIGFHNGGGELYHVLDG